MRWLLLILGLVSGLPVRAENPGIIAAPSQNRVAITTGFTGSELLIFGAIKRAYLIKPGHPPDIIVTVTGPETKERVHRKARRLGLWVTVESWDLGRVPDFYSVSTTAPLPEILPQLTDEIYDISTEAHILPEDRGAPERDALLRLRHASGQYEEREGAVSLIDGALFSTRVKLPADLTEGFYQTRVFLLQDGLVVDDFSTAVAVRKDGFERWIYNLAFRHEILYALMSLTIAAGFGWLASAVFGRR